MAGEKLQGVSRKQRRAKFDLELRLFRKSEGSEFPAPGLNPKQEIRKAKDSGRNSKSFAHVAKSKCGPELPTFLKVGGVRVSCVQAIPGQEISIRKKLRARDSKEARARRESQRLT